MLRWKIKSLDPEEFYDKPSSNSESDSGETSSENEATARNKDIEKSAMLVKRKKRVSTELGPENSQNEFGNQNKPKQRMSMVEKPLVKKFKGQHKPRNFEQEESNVSNLGYKRNIVSTITVPKISNDSSENSESDMESSSDEKSDSENDIAENFDERKHKQDSGQYLSKQSALESERFISDKHSGEPSDNEYNTSADHDNDDDYKSGESEAGTEQDEYSAIRKELADIPFEDLLKIKEKVGVKAFNKILHGSVEDQPKQKIFKRKSRHKPREMSSKRPVAVLKNRTAVKKWTARDPRFDDLSGEYKEYHFTKNYSFLEDMKEKEREVVKKQMKKTRNDEKKRELKGLLNRLQQEQQVKETKKKKQDLEKMYVEKEREMVKQGKTPYFLKQSDKKTLELAMKFKELKQAGRLDSYMSKKRKKVAQKQRKKMPSQQSGVI